MATVKAKPAAGPNPRRPLSPETRARMSAAHKGRPGHPVSAETRAKMAAAHKGRALSPAHRAKMSAAHKGHEVSPETRAKLAAALKGHEVSPETRARMSAAKKGRRRGIPGSVAEGPSFANGHPYRQPQLLMYEPVTAIDPSAIPHDLNARL
jgi:hypothetical protein